MSYQVKITYFKESGKYYSEGEYTSTKAEMFEIFEECIAMRFSGKPAPGLSSDGSGFYWLIEVPTHPHDHPHLIVKHDAASD